MKEEKSLNILFLKWVLAVLVTDAGVQVVEG